jgi:hypothetical protein
VAPRASAPKSKHAPGSPGACANPSRSVQIPTRQARAPAPPHHQASCSRTRW